MHTFFNFLVYIAFIQLAANHQNALLANTTSGLNYVPKEEADKYAELLANLQKVLNPQHNPNIHSFSHSLLFIASMIGDSITEYDLSCVFSGAFKESPHYAKLYFLCQNEPFTLTIPAIILNG